uniref:Nucleotide-diphospho-sugar transferase domain-containing protein n=1 Tax=Ananas comosus var. bracteatus TaxID=296719 RepID=A0A6V7Q844_ANACO|nr:unnamed protein product [Ananas comosus var. bracteatus]
MSNLSPLVSFLLGVAMTIACVFFYMSVDPWKRSVEISSWSKSGNSDSNVDGVNETMFAPNSEVDHAQLAPKEMPQTKDLASLLKSVAMDDNTVILTEINEAWATPNSLLDLFLESFRIGEHIEHLLDHLLIVAVDQKAFDRNKFQQSILELGYNFLFTDVDIIWFRDPLRRIAITSHIAISSDFFFGDEDSLRNLPNGGFSTRSPARRPSNSTRTGSSRESGFPESTSSTSSTK